MPAGGQSYAVEALGLGDQLKQQVGEDTEERTHCHAGNREREQHQPRYEGGGAHIGNV